MRRPTREPHSLFSRPAAASCSTPTSPLAGGIFSATANDSVDLGTDLADRGTGPGSFTMAPGVTINTSFDGQSIFARTGAAASNTGGGGDFTPGTISLANLTTAGGEVFAGSNGNLI